MFWKIQEICSKTGTKISKIDGEMPEIFDSKVGNPENSVIRNWANLSHPWNLTFFMISFFNFFLDHMVQKYQNEIPPISYYRISTKSSEKVLNIPNLQALTLGCIIKMTLYNGFSLKLRRCHETNFYKRRN